MNTYIIGDIHGCYDELKYLLRKVNFNFKKDKLWITGDLIFKGPKSIEVLKFIYKIRKKVNIVLGNNDITLIKITYFKEKSLLDKKLLNFLKTTKFKKIILWLKNQNLIKICEKKKIIMVHAGIHFEWNIKTLKKYNIKTKKIISNIEKFPVLFKKIYNNNKANIWKKKMNFIEKISFTINSLTRMRFYYKNKKLDFKKKNINQNTNKYFIPWFYLKNKNLKKYTIIFGHWSSLYLYKNIKKKNNYIGLDTGCYFGGYLSILNLKNKKIYKTKKF